MHLKLAIPLSTNGCPHQKQVLKTHNLADSAPGSLEALTMEPSKMSLFEATFATKTTDFERRASKSTSIYGYKVYGSLFEFECLFDGMKHSN